MKNIKELLTILRDYIENKPFLWYNNDPTTNHSVGLCHMCSLCCLTDSEFDLLVSYIQHNRPTSGCHYDSLRSCSLWYWESGLVKPRLDWLNDEIAKH
jgi:hypothetical protein